MARQMKMREFQRRLLGAGCSIRQGKGRHLVVKGPDGRHLGSLSNHAAEVGPGTVIAFERALGRDLDGLNPRKPKAGVVGGPTTRKDAEPPDGTGGVRGTPAAPATSSSDEEDGAATRKDADPVSAIKVEPEAMHAPSSSLPFSPDASREDEILAKAVAFERLESLLNGDDHGLRLRSEKGEVIVEFLDQRGATVRRRVATGRDLTTAVEAAR